MWPISWPYLVYPQLWLGNFRSLFFIVDDESVEETDVDDVADVDDGLEVTSPVFTAAAVAASFSRLLFSLEKSGLNIKFNPGWFHGLAGADSEGGISQEIRSKIKVKINVQVGQPRKRTRCEGDTERHVHSIMSPPSNWASASVLHSFKTKTQWNPFHYLLPTASFNNIASHCPLCINPLIIFYVEWFMHT